MSTELYVLCCGICQATLELAATLEQMESGAVRNWRCAEHPWTPGGPDDTDKWCRPVSGGAVSSLDALRAKADERQGRWAASGEMKIPISRWAVEFEWFEPTPEEGTTLRILVERLSRNEFDRLWEELAAERSRRDEADAFSRSADPRAKGGR